MRRLAFLGAPLLFLTVAARAQTVDAIADSWIIGGPCPITSGLTFGTPTNDYQTFNDNFGVGVNTVASFLDPTPPGSVVRSISVRVFGVFETTTAAPPQCNVAGEIDEKLTVTVDGATLPAITVGGGAFNCYPNGVGNGVADAVSQTYSGNGFPGYHYADPNFVTLNFAGLVPASSCPQFPNPGGGQITIEAVRLTINYAVQTADLVASGPVVPAGATTDTNGCILYSSTLTATLHSGSTPVSGKTVTFTSDRNVGGANPDVFTQPATPTNKAGVATGSVRTRKQGAAGISVGGFEPPLQAGFTTATYEDKFLVTQYYTPDEQTFTKGGDSTACGLSGPHNTQFIKAVKVEGSGRLVNGTTIRYENGCYSVDPKGCPETSSQTCAVAGVTAAVDNDVIPRISQITVEGFGNRSAEDAGGAITGHHVDIYVGIGGKDLASGKFNNRVVMYLSGNNPCN